MIALNKIELTLERQVFRKIHSLWPVYFCKNKFNNREVSKSNKNVLCLLAL